MLNSECRPPDGKIVLFLVFSLLPITPVTHTPSKTIKNRLYTS